MRTTGAYGWHLNGYTGYTTSAANFTGQPGAMSANFATSGYPSFALWNSTIPYWFVVNARRIIVVAKVSTTYQALYMGFFLPYATPSQYPYPLLIAGSSINNGGQPLYNSVNGTANNLWGSTFNTISNSSRYPLCYRTPGGVWSVLDHGAASNSGINQNVQNIRGLRPWVDTDLDLQRATIDGSGVLIPVEIQHRLSAVDRGRFGELEGVYGIPGFGQAPESIITYGGNDHLVVPNVFRSGLTDLAAIKLV
jgi:hypothetical protein